MNQYHYQIPKYHYLLSHLHFKDKRNKNSHPDRTQFLCKLKQLYFKLRVCSRYGWRLGSTSARADGARVASTTPVELWYKGKGRAGETSSCGDFVLLWVLLRGLFSCFISLTSVYLVKYFCVLSCWFYFSINKCKYEIPRSSSVVGSCAGDVSVGIYLDAELHFEYNMKSRLWRHSTLLFFTVAVFVIYRVRLWCRYFYAWKCIPKGKFVFLK